MKPEYSAIKEKCFTSYLSLVYLLLNKCVNSIIFDKNSSLFSDLHFTDFFFFILLNASIKKLTHISVHRSRAYLQELETS